MNKTSLLYLKAGLLMMAMGGAMAGMIIQLSPPPQENVGIEEANEEKKESENNNKDSEQKSEDETKAKESSDDKSSPLPYGVETVVEAVPENTAPNCNIKGNISYTGEKIYHMPGQEYYDETKIDTGSGEKWFCSEAEAQAAGWRKSKT